MAAESRRTDRGYEVELTQLRGALLLMAGRVEQMISQSVRALLERDEDLARETIEEDGKVNQAEIDIDEQALNILARRQPLASDLRFITLALKIVTDLERLGDLAVNICERALDLCRSGTTVGHDGINQMTTVVQEMIKGAVDAFVNNDEARARAVIEQDNEVDELYQEIFRDLLTRMCKNPEDVHSYIHIQSVAKWLERMADHTTNVAEMVVFMVKGKDIRHPGKLV